MATEAGRVGWREALARPCDPRGLAAFRALFGFLMLGATVRFVLKGWVDELYVAPGYHFSYWGFEWVTPWSRAGMYLHFGLLGVSALCLGIGVFTRASAAVFCLAFSYVELIDKATYLNHYYLVSLLALLLVVAPAEAAWSFDARFRGKGRASIGVWAYWLLRAQVTIVYLFAGLAKLNADWLFSAEPLATWLEARADTPVIGRWLSVPAVAYGMSWAGLLFDLSIAPLLLLRRTRAPAFAAALVFHLAVWALFPIGVFSFVMLIALSVFFEPNWPARLLRLGNGASVSAQRTSPSRWILAFGAIYLTLQLLVPFRFLLYPGAVNWTEQGFRFAWRVMLIEKAGSLEYRIVTRDRRTFHVFPRRELTGLQFKMLATQPDMIHQYARKLAQDFAKRGQHGARVYADSWVSLNGRRAQRLIDPNIDLAAEPYSFSPKPWILPSTATASR